MQMQPITKQVQANGISLSYNIYPHEQAPVLVLIPGLSSTKEAYDLMIPHLTEHYHILTLDLRGHGQSDRQGPYSFAQLNEDIKAVLDHEGIDRATLVGGSFSSVPVQQFAVRYPERVDQLVLVDGGYFRRGDRLDFDLEALKQQPPFSADTQEEMVEGVMQSYGPLANDAIREQLKREIEVGEDGRAYLAMPHEAFLAYAVEYATYDRDALLSTLRVPVLVLLADQPNLPDDLRAFLESSLQDYLRRVPTARTVKIPQGHHALMLSHPQATSEAIHSFVTGSMQR